MLVLSVPRSPSRVNTSDTTLPPASHSTKLPVVVVLLVISLDVGQPFSSAL